MAEFRGGPRGAPWTAHDRLLMLGLQAYEDDLCTGCGWPRTYSMHKESRAHWHASDAIRCHACTAKRAKEDQVGGETRPGAYFVARPSPGLLHAMTDPVLDPPAQTGPLMGASGVIFHPPSHDDEASEEV